MKYFMSKQINKGDNVAILVPLTDKTRITIKKSSRGSIVSIDGVSVTGDTYTVEEIVFSFSGSITIVDFIKSRVVEL